jgi:sugar lactone lactonase YvrE
MDQVEHILSINNQLGEGPLWNSDEQALYWVDIFEGCFYRLYTSTGEYQAIKVGLPIGVLAFRASGGLVMATKRGFAFWEPHNHSLHHIADPESGNPDSRFNDGAVDRQGRFWAGTMVDNDGPVGSLYRLDPDRSVHKMETGVTIFNGIGWSPDNKTMYYTDSPLYVIYAYDFDAATGCIANRRPFIRTPEGEGIPDGLTVDSQGFIWSARWGGWKVSRYDPAGKLEREVEVPVQNPSSCTFGGKDLDELYITTAWLGLNDAQQREQPWAGDLFRLQPGIKGLETPRYAG